MSPWNCLPVLSLPSVLWFQAHMLVPNFLSSRSPLPADSKCSPLSCPCSPESEGRKGSGLRGGSVKCPLCRHEGLTLDPQVVWHIPVIPVLGAEADGSLEFIGLLAKPSKRALGSV